MYFRTVAFWQDVTRGLSAASEANPWEKRKNKVWWRGASGMVWPACRPRVYIVSRYFDKPWADFAFTNSWRFVWMRWRRTDMRFHVPRNAVILPSGEERKMGVHLIARYRFGLLLPGSFSGTYSRSLQFLLWTGVNVIKYDFPYDEFFYHRMKPWVHYIPSTDKNLPNRMAWAGEHPAELAAMRQAAKELAEEYISAQAVAKYWTSLMQEYGTLQRYEVTLPTDACTCGEGSQKLPPPWLPKGSKRCPFLCHALAFIAKG